MWNGLPRSGDRGGRARSTRSAGPASTTTTRGAGRSPATRRSSGGSGRPTRAAWPTRCIVHWPRGIAGPGRGPHASTCTPSTSRRPCSSSSGSTRPPVIDGVEQKPIEGTSFALLVRRRRRARPAHDAVLRDVRLPGDLPRRVEGGHVPRHPGRRARPRQGDVGALRRPRRPERVPRPRGGRARAAGRDGRAVVAGGRGPPGAAARQPAVLGPRVRPPDRRAAARRATSTGRTARRCPRATRRTCATAPTT